MGSSPASASTRDTGNTGTHVGALWTSAGVQLATATFTGETASGWQQVNFASPVAVTANTVYVASYLAPNGRYAGDSSYFANAGVDNPPLHALRNGVSGGNGVYCYGARRRLPGDHLQSSNYWVDVVFTTAAPLDTTPPTVTSTLPAGGASAVALGSAVTATFSEPMDAATISGSTFVLSSAAGQVTASVSYNAATRVATLTPSGALTPSTIYTATVRGGATDPRVKDVASNALAASLSWSFTTVAVDTTPPAVTATSPTVGATGVSTTSAVTATFSEAIDPATIGTGTFELRAGGAGGSLIAATVSYNAGVATLIPSAALATSTTYTAIVKGGATDPRVKDLASNPLAASSTWSFTTAATSGGCPCTVWPSSATPTVASAGDTSAVNLGVKFTSSQSGYITGIRFYKGTGNTGTHIGALWTSAGVQLAAATFAGETASGWQQVNFATPVAITANTVYVASYLAPNGGYAINSGYFATTGVSNSPLVALQNGVSGGNGVYSYGSGVAFPSSTYSSANYWVGRGLHALTVSPAGRRSSGPCDLADHPCGLSCSFWAVSAEPDCQRCSYGLERCG